MTTTMIRRALAAMLTLAAVRVFAVAAQHPPVPIGTNDRVQNVHGDGAMNLVVWRSRHAAATIK